MQENAVFDPRLRPQDSETEAKPLEENDQQALREALNVKPS